LRKAVDGFGPAIVQLDFELNPFENLAFLLSAIRSATRLRSKSGLNGDFGSTTSVLEEGNYPGPRKAKSLTRWISPGQDLRWLLEGSLLTPHSAPLALEKFD